MSNPTAEVIARAHGTLRLAAADVLAAYQRFLDTDDLEVLRDSLTGLSEALDYTEPLGCDRDLPPHYEPSVEE